MNTHVSDIEAREKAATVAELLPHISGEELRKMHAYDAYYFARQLNEARGKLEAVGEWADKFPLEAVRDARYELDCILKGASDG